MTGQIFDLGKEALDHLGTFISTRGEMNLTEVTGDKTHSLLITAPIQNRESPVLHERVPATIYRGVTFTKEQIMVKDSFKNDF